ncbi:hypothetical protein PoMZ_09436 [Pyricularia oryzae]|uniref:Uncharacterized protein n=1 Tax=Pyricularia oryzae TaxID=318829 RepID=A0A4P7MZR9_PYROR|nr:hypothetical protein PoMZ_09436 [Pyricularia oryzae]
MGVPEYWPRDASGRHGVRVACDGESAGNGTTKIWPWTKKALTLSNLLLCLACIAMRREPTLMSLTEVREPGLTRAGTAIASSVRNNDARLKIALIDNASSPIKG